MIHLASLTVPTGTAFNLNLKLEWSDDYNWSLPAVTLGRTGGSILM